MRHRFGRTPALLSVSCAIALAFGTAAPAQRRAAPPPPPAQNDVPTMTDEDTSAAQQPLTLSGLADFAEGASYRDIGVIGGLQLLGCSQRDGDYHGYWGVDVAEPSSGTKIYSLSGGRFSFITYKDFGPTLASVIRQHRDAQARIVFEVDSVDYARNHQKALTLRVTRVDWYGPDGRAIDSAIDDSVR